VTRQSRTAGSQEGSCGEQGSDNGRQANSECDGSVYEGVGDGSQEPAFPRCSERHALCEQYWPFAPPTMAIDGGERVGGVRADLRQRILYPALTPT
jgi:hypothetical protein